MPKCQVEVDAKSGAPAAEMAERLPPVWAFPNHTLSFASILISVGEEMKLPVVQVLEAGWRS